MSLLTIFTVLGTLYIYDPNQTVTQLLHVDFNKDEHPCLIFAFYNRLKRQFIQQPPEGILVQEIFSGS